MGHGLVFYKIIPVLGNIYLNCRRQPRYGVIIVGSLELVLLVTDFLEPSFDLTGQDADFRRNTGDRIPLFSQFKGLYGALLLAFNTHFAGIDEIFYCCRILRRLLSHGRCYGSPVVEKIFTFPIKLFGRYLVLVVIYISGRFVGYAHHLAVKRPFYDDLGIFLSVIWPCTFVLVPMKRRKIPDAIECCRLLFIEPDLYATWCNRMNVRVEVFVVGHDDLDMFAGDFLQILIAYIGLVDDGLPADGLELLSYGPVTHVVLRPFYTVHKVLWSIGPVVVPVLPYPLDAGHVVPAKHFRCLGYAEVVLSFNDVGHDLFKIP